MPIFAAILENFEYYDPCLYQFLHWIRGHRYTRRLILSPISASGVARAFLGGRLAHPEGQNEEENKLSLRKNLSQFEEKMRKVELLPTQDCEAGYGPDLSVT